MDGFLLAFRYTGKGPMTWNPYPPVPLGALRDLLGITRLLYRAGAAAEPRDEARLLALQAIGTALTTALRLSTAPPGTIDHGNAWAAAERATRELTELVGDDLNLSPVLAATVKLVSRPGSMV